MAARAAATNCSLLLTGETGTGKGFLARWIHEQSARRSGPFVPVNCGAIPESLIDSHLFGHARGSFSGADADHTGLVRAANGGTILFDEISELPVTAQTRLLRLLEEREVQPVGYSKPVLVNVRIIAATNTDLIEAVRRGRFRQDLFFRLDVVRLDLKPLRERTHAIPALLRAFNEEFASIYQQSPLWFDQDIVGALERYDWPGNIRELRTVIERLHVLGGGINSAVTLHDLRQFGQLHIADETSPQWSASRVHELRASTVQDVLSACRGNVSRAALRLGVHRSTIYRWLAAQTVSA
jgi:two-component system response regulator HydG